MNPVVIISAAIANSLGAAVLISLFMTGSVYIDKETGCEYLVGGLNQLTPRIAADYMHMGCKGVQDNE